MKIGHCIQCQKVKPTIEIEGGFFCADCFAEGIHKHVDQIIRNIKNIPRPELPKTTKEDLLKPYKGSMKGSSKFKKHYSDKLTTDELLELKKKGDL